MGLIPLRRCLRRWGFIFFLGTSWCGISVSFCGGEGAFLWGACPRGCREFTSSTAPFLLGLLLEPACSSVKAETH